jgi:hypothetical protein
MTARKTRKKPARPSKLERKIDEEVNESFPASDPPAFAGGAIGAPAKRKTPQTRVTKRK